MCGRVGRFTLEFSRSTGLGILLLGQSFLCFRYALTKRARKEIINQMYTAGIKSLGVVTVVALFTGMILALQTGIELRRFSQEVNIGTAVMVSMLREMGPFMTGLILAACVGSGFAAQIGTMVVSEEISALEIMSIDPIKFLVMPRMVAMLIMTPLIAFFTCLMGVLGGGIVGATQLDVAWVAYLDNATLYAQGKDMFVGLLKALVFGLIITTVACNEGFETTGGAVGVGITTRKTVIVSFLLILVMGYFITRWFYI